MLPPVGPDHPHPAPEEPTLGCTSRSPASTESAGREVARSRLLARWAGAVAVTVLVAVTVAGAGWRDEDPSPRPLRPAPAFDVARLDRPGERIRLTDFRDTPVLVNFWASWCVPCREEMPELEAVRARYGGRLEVVGINMWDDPESAGALLEELGVTYPQGVDRSGDVVRAFGIDVVPSTAFITADGRFAALANGKPSPAELQSMISEHLGL